MGARILVFHMAGLGKDRNKTWLLWKEGSFKDYASGLQFNICLGSIWKQRGTPWHWDPSTNKTQKLALAMRK